MSNVLPRDKQIAVVAALTEGCSVRSTERLVGVSRETVLSLLVRVGSGCAVLLDEWMRDLPCAHVEVDELWSYVGKKQRHVRENDDPSLGDTWTYVALCRDTKLVPCYRVGKRDAKTTCAFVQDLASRMRNRVQLSSDGFRAYVDAVERAFGSDVDYATIVKSYEVEPIGPGRYSPPKVTSIEKMPIIGSPELGMVCTSFVERQNLTARMRVRRLTRLTNAFSKKIENHEAAMALHFFHYNFVAMHRTLRMTPALAAGVADKLWTLDDLVEEALGRVAA